MAEPGPALPQVLPQGKQIFDQHSPPSQQLIDECVHCGFCLPTCPTYNLWHQEMDSPRGRIYLMKRGLDGQVEGMDETYVTHFDRCLGCMACVSSCPSGVKYDRLIEATRAQIERNYPRSWAERSFRRMILWLFPHPNRLRVALFPMWIYQRLGLRWLLHKLGLIRLLPERYRALEALLPEVPLRSMWTNLPVRFAPAGPARRRVGLLLGCVQRTFFSDVNAATARVLAAEGCEVIIPRHQGCCGALGTHAGYEQQALTLARRTIDTFEGAQVDTIVINAAGCGSSMKEYGYLLRHDPAYADRAKAFAAKCKDVSEVLAELEPQATRHPIPLRIAYQDACHLQHAQAVRIQPREVLRTIPGLEVLELPEAALCCGSAGIYNLVQPGPALELGEQKVQSLYATGAEGVVSGNPGCLLQMTSIMRDLGRVLPAFHFVELLDASIRGVWPAIPDGRPQPRPSGRGQQRFNPAYVPAWRKRPEKVR